MTSTSGGPQYQGPQNPYTPQSGNPGQQSGNPGQPYRQPSQPQRPALGSEFFNWIRSLNFYRSTDRWVGGVSGAIANRIGWDPLIIRIIWFAFFCAAGFGALLYGLAWMLLPDERDGTILLEEAITHGRFPAAFWLSALMMLIGCPGSVFAVPFISIPVFIALIVAAIILYNRDQNRRNATSPGNPGQSGFGGPGNPGDPRQPYGPGAPNGPQSAASQPNQPTGTGAQPNQPGQTNQSQPGNNQPYNPFRTQTPSNGPTFYAGPQRMRPVPPAVVYRRKPAGPVVVGIASGLILLSLAALVAMIAFGFIPGEVSIVTLIAVWILGITLALGLLTIVLGFVGRKTGGLIPITIVAIIASLCAYAVLPSVNHAGATIDSVTNSAYVNALHSESRTYHSSDWEQLVDGGLKVVNSTVTIDLRDWDSRDWSSANSETGLNYSSKDYRGCPVGELDLEAVNSTVTLLTPKGCATGFGDINQAFSQLNLEDSNGTRYSTSDSVVIDRNGDSVYSWDSRYENIADKSAYIDGELVFSTVTVQREVSGDSSSSSNPYTS
ncbi:PspC domain-containing protein [Bifidobacterium simiarum]|uniref:PspC domain-containing protein n=1 Tax=Bifidobacterium simiarum TaxID=2045441 RepID=UPI001BDC0929|nr:PspC domain-containing protein [Bifidobacterium simiarum]MBT1166355.1 PspC domain-containing protein [Bifidobacterium simiarum]